jgi:RNA polymerase sigma-70 factor (ECF subfamily)
MDDERRVRFEAVALPFMKSLYNTASVWTGRSADAADLVQETYLRAYRTFDSFQKGTNCKAWLFTIMRSIFVNKYRKRQREPEAIPFESFEERFDELLADSPEDRHLFLIRDLGLDWKGSQPERALEKLPEKFRSAVVLVDVEDLTYEEAARVLGCPMGTLRSRLFRGRKALFVELESYAQEIGYLKTQK